MLKQLISVFALGASVAIAQTPAAAPPSVPSQRLRGTIEKVDATTEKVDATTLVLNERSGETVTLAIASDLSIDEIVPIGIGAIKHGSFIGTAAMPQSDGSLKALQVTVFPEAARGNGEGSYAWDLRPGSTMTNATVADLVAAPTGRTLKLAYKGGEKTDVVPPDVPIVTFRPGDRSLLVPGARVQITAQLRDGKPTAVRALAGCSGVSPPM